jgi:hypothetical protein
MFSKFDPPMSSNLGNIIILLKQNNYIFAIFDFKNKEDFCISI